MIVQLLTNGEGVEDVAEAEEKKEEPEKSAEKIFYESIREDLAAASCKLQDVGMMFIELSDQLSKVVEGIIKLNA